MRIVQRNTTTYPIPVLMVLASDHVSGATGKTLTVNVSKNGAAFASFSGTISELSYGWYSLVIAVGDVDTLGTLAIHVDASGCDPVDLACQVVAFNPADAVRLGLSSLPNETAGAVNGLPLGDGSGRVLLQPTQTGVTIPTVTDLTTKTGFSLSSDGILAIWHELVASVTQVGSLGALLRDTLDAAVSSRADQTVVQSAMTAQGYTSIRAGYLDVLNGLVSAIWGAASRTLTAISDSAGVTTLLSRIGQALSFTSGRVNAQVGGMDADTLTAAAVAADAVAEIGGGGGATAGEIADAVLDELISGHTTSGSLAAAISTIEGKTALLGSASALITQAVIDESGDLIISKGKDYKGSRAPSWSRTITYAGATISTARLNVAGLSITGSITNSGGVVTVSADISRTAFDGVAPGVYPFEVELDLTVGLNTEVVQFTTGKCRVSTNL